MTTERGPKIFYQSSMPRSGSTLLQNILAQNPAFYVTPNSGLVDLILQARHQRSTFKEFVHQDSDLTKRALIGFCRSGAEGYFRAITDKAYVMDKARAWASNFDLLALLFGEEPKIICLVRDLRQILSSMEKRYRQIPFRNRAIENPVTGQGMTTYQRAQIHLQSVPLGASLDTILELHLRGMNKKLLFLKYEDLTARPDETLRKVYSYLNIMEYKHDFKQVPIVTQEDDQIPNYPDPHVGRFQVESTEKDFKSVLGPEALNYVQTHYAWYFKLFDYWPSAVS